MHRSPAGREQTTKNPSGRRPGRKRAGHFSPQHMRENHSAEGRVKRARTCSRPIVVSMGEKKGAKNAGLIQQSANALELRKTKLGTKSQLVCFNFTRKPDKRQSRIALNAGSYSGHARQGRGSRVLKSNPDKRKEPRGCGNPLGPKGCDGTLRADVEVGQVRLHGPAGQISLFLCSRGLRG